MYWTAWHVIVVIFVLSIPLLFVVEEKGIARQKKEKFLAVPALYSSANPMARHSS
jgi:hypothetical protein